MVAALNEALVYWLRYRDDVAAECGIERDPDGLHRLAARTEFSYLPKNSTAYPLSSGKLPRSPRDSQLKVLLLPFL